MLHNLFMSPFYGRYKVENHEELTSSLSKTAEDVEDYYGWNQHCNVQVKMIQDFEFALPYLKPYLFQFSDELGVKLDYAFVDSAWVSCYNKGGFQEVHQHANSDISVVYCMNSGIDFAKFYFIDRHSNDFFYLDYLRLERKANEKGYLNLDLILKIKISNHLITFF